MKKFHFISGIHNDLYRRPMLSMNYSTGAGGVGHPGFFCHKQPALEKAIRDAISGRRCSELRSSCLVTAVSEDDKNVRVQYTNKEGQQKTVEAKFLVGADGKTGFVRKKYLEPQGITMERCEGTNYEETWVALNWKITLPTEKTHPQFPLWNLGYTPLQVYDMFFPDEFRFLCNPARPAVCGRFGLPEDRLWRFEFVVQAGEDGTFMATPEQTAKIIFPYLTHQGSRYGLHHDVQFPEDCITVLRSRPFSFQARSCNKWALGRVILAGDAAHVFPPFGGQGIASGFRDAFALAWRLKLLHEEPGLDHEHVIRAWYLERKQQLERSLAATIHNGDLVTASNPLKIFVRDWSLWLMQMVPSWKRALETGSQGKGMARYKYQQGLPFTQNGFGGKLLPQVYAWDFATNRVRFTDDLIFSPQKQGLFQLLLLPRTIDEAARLLAGIRDLPQPPLLQTSEATVVLQDPAIEQDAIKELVNSQAAVARVATGEEFARDAVLCRNRPAPKYYDPYRISAELPGMKLVVVRPDRFVYTSCETVEQLAGILSQLSEQSL